MLIVTLPWEVIAMSTSDMPKAVRYFSGFGAQFTGITWITVGLWGWYIAMRQCSALVRAQIMTIVEATGRVSPSDAAPALKLDTTFAALSKAVAPGLLGIAACGQWRSFRV